jgi:hypothetical protein
MTRSPNPSPGTACQGMRCLQASNEHTSIASNRTPELQVCGEFNSSRTRDRATPRGSSLRRIAAIAEAPSSSNRYTRPTVPEERDDPPFLPSPPRLQARRQEKGSSPRAPSSPRSNRFRWKHPGTPAWRKSSWWGERKEELGYRKTLFLPHGPEEITLPGPESEKCPEVCNALWRDPTHFGPFLPPGRTPCVMFHCCDYRAGLI